MYTYVYICFVLVYCTPYITYYRLLLAVWSQARDLARRAPPDGLRGGPPPGHADTLTYKMR